MVIPLYLMPFAKFSFPIITFFYFPQLFRRVAAALPGMESTQDRSREDSILSVSSENVIVITVIEAPLGWLRNITPLLFTARNWWLRNIEALRFSIEMKSGYPSTPFALCCSLQLISERVRVCLIDWFLMSRKLLESQSSASS